MFIRKGRFLSIILSVLMLWGCLPISAAASSSASGISGGSAAVISPSYSVAAPMIELTVRGTIYLPDGFTAPRGGLPIYGAFGGVTLGSLSLFAADADIEEIETTAYEKATVLTTVPAGCSSASYETTIQIASGSDAFYGGVWVYDTGIMSADGMRYLSNKINTSAITRLKAGVTDYGNITAALTAAEGLLRCEVSFDEALAQETPNQTIYILADDGYDTYITRQSFNRCDTAFDVNLRTDNGTYTLQYYVPVSSFAENQAIQSGTYRVGTADAEKVNSIVIGAQPCISGTINRPDNNTAEALQLTVSTSVTAVTVTLPKGAESVAYRIAAKSEGNEYLHIEVLNSDFYISGYWDGGDFCDSRCYYVYITESVADVAVTLQRCCLIRGQIDLPPTVTMEQNTYFKLYVQIESESYGDSQRVKQYADGNAEFSFSVPYDYRDEHFILSYHYGSYETPSVFPDKPVNPLTSYKASSSGGGGSSGGATDSYTYQEPEGLLYDRLIYTSSTGGSFNKAQAQAYAFVDGLIEADITLAAEGNIKDSIAIGGYFTDVLSHNTDVEIQLLDAETGTLCRRQTPDSTDGSYRFTGMGDGLYTIAAVYNNTTYYYTGKQLSTLKSAAKIIDTAAAPVSYGNDLYYDNIFPTDIRCETEVCRINDVETTAEIGLYDTEGHCRATFTTDDTIVVSFSPFVMSLNGLYVSSYNTGKGFCIETLTDDFSQADVIKAEYRNFISLKTAQYSPKCNMLYINVALPDGSSDNWLNEGCYSEPLLSGGTFFITTPEELAWVAYKVRTGSLFVNKTVKLMSDLDLSAHSWIPIGGEDENGNLTSFQGTFDGNGYTISGLRIGTAAVHTAYESCGLFGRTQSAVLKRVSLKDVAVYNSGQHSGALVGYALQTTMQYISAGGTVKGSGYTGGLVGYSEESTIQNSISSVEISGRNNGSGLLAGYFWGTIENSAALTLCEGLRPAANGGATVRNCYVVTGDSELCFYDKKEGEQETLPLTGRDESLLKRLNQNSNPEWGDWQFNDDGYPVITTETNRFFKPCSEPLTETDGTYTVTTAAELAWVAECVNNGNCFEGKTVVLAADIDLSSKYWLPIGNGECLFEGRFDGQNHTISGLHFDDSSASYVGLFGAVQNAVIANLRLMGISICADSYVGALCGAAYNTTIDNIDITGTVSGSTYIGGVTGFISKISGGIQNTRVTGSVTGETNVGGLVGRSYHTHPCIAACFSGRVSGELNIGGLIGYSNYSGMALTDCYAVGQIEGDSYIGGLVGMGIAPQLTRCYSDTDLYGGLYVGALIGDTKTDAAMRSVYWNLDRTQQEDGFTLPNDSKKAVGSGAEGGTALSPIQFSDESNFSGWDFDTLWAMQRGFPMFRRYIHHYAYTVNDVSVTGNYAVANVTKTDDTTENGYILYAVYADDTLIDLVRDVVDMEKGTAMLQSSRTLKFGNVKPNKLKVFIWSKQGIPLAQSMTVTL